MPSRPGLAPSPTSLSSAAGAYAEAMPQPALAGRFYGGALPTASPASFVADMLMARGLGTRPISFAEDGWLMYAHRRRQRLERADAMAGVEGAAFRRTLRGHG